MINENVEYCLENVTVLACILVAGAWWGVGFGDTQAVFVGREKIPVATDE